MTAPWRPTKLDVVIGSRYMKGGKDMDRPFHRQNDQQLRPLLFEDRAGS